MTSCHHLIQDSKKHNESPAKVFAKLKSKVHRETYEMTVGGKDAQCNVRGKHGSNVHTPRRRKEISDAFKGNENGENIHGEVKALTLSPIRSPQKGLGFLYSDFNTIPVEKLPYSLEMGHPLTPRNGCTQTKRPFLESTTLSYQPSNDMRTEQSLIRGLDGFTAPTQSPANKVSCRREVFREESAPHGRILSPDTRVSPGALRLRKRKLELNEVGNRAMEGKCQPKERKTSATFIEDNTYTDDSETCPNPSGPMFAIPAQFTNTRSKVVLDRFPLMSPAKIFAYMKGRENKIEQNEVPKVNNTTWRRFDDVALIDHQCQATDEPDFTVCPADATQNMYFGGAHDNMPSASPTKIESSDNQSDTHLPDSEPLSAVPSQPVLLEDPLVLLSPRVSIPKRQDEMVKRNKCFQRAAFPTETVIYLRKWFLRKGQRGLFIDGIHREENIPWNSNIIVERISSTVLKTVSGRVYILVGKMNLSIESEFPKWFLKHFTKGFPPDWKTLYEMFLSKSGNLSGENKTRNESRSRSKKKTETSTVIRPVKPCIQKPLKKSHSCDSSDVSYTKTSRSGRLIKPPLEYWKGGRVIVDAHMNVTIHECYNTSISHITTTVTTKSSQKTPRRTRPKSCDSAVDTEPSAVLRKVKPPLRKRNRLKGHLEEELFSPPEPPEKAATHQNTPKQGSGRITRSRFKSERTSYMDRGSKSQSEPEKSPTPRSRKRTPGANGAARKSKRWAVFTDSSTGSENTSPNLATDDDASFTGKKRGNRARGRRGADALEKSQPGYLSSTQSESSGNSRSKQRKKSQKRITANNNTALEETDSRRSKHGKASTPPEHLPKFTQSSKTQRGGKGKPKIPQEEDEDRWTEDELVKLKEAVSRYPKHIGGYWAKVAWMVGTRSAEECYNQQTSMGSSKTPVKKDKTKKTKAEPPKDPAAQLPVISARVGTLKRKQQVRNFLESMPKENVDDAFTGAYMQGKRFEMPSVCLSEDHEFTMSDLEARSPTSTGFPEVATPQCLHISPGMMASPSRTHDDKYVYQLQKRMKKNYFNVHAPAPKNFSPTPTVKRTMKRCADTENSFVVWDMFPDKEDALSESGEEDFYFSNDD